MGCKFSKSSAVESRERLSSKRSSELSVSRGEFSKREDGFRVRDRMDNADKKIVLIEKNVNGSMQSLSCSFNHPGSGRVPKARVCEHVAAGWPAWLCAVAGEAINGWLPLCADNFEKIDKIGQGTYSDVFKAYDTVHSRIVALKKVRFDYLDAGSVKFMTREIVILRRLNHPNVVKLEGLIASPTSSKLYLVFEYMEHDLTGLASRPGLKFTESQVKCYMKQLLSGLDHCHSHGVLHRDIKGSNLLIDNNGVLKIADFGLANFFNAQHSVPLTSRVVTLWYRPPELLLGARHYDAAVDLWSTGCILGELYAGKPILPGKTEVEQLHKIFRLCGSPSEDYWRNSKLPHSTVFKPLHPYKRCIGETFRQIPAAAVGLLETLLAVDPADRGTADLALKSAFFTTKPLACDPSSLPKYPPSKELDVKLLERETKRRGTSRDTGQRAEQERRGPRERHGVPLPNANSETVMSMQKRRSEKPNSLRDGTTSNRDDKDPSRELLDDQRKRRVSHSGPLVLGNGLMRAKKENDDTLSGRPNLSSFSGPISSTPSLFSDCQEKLDPSRPRSVHNAIRPQNSFTGQNPHIRGSNGNKIYVSGPLLGSSNWDRMLEEHGRKVELSRRARFDRKADR